MIEVRNLHKSFGSKQVLTGVDLTIPEGESLCIIGKSGCGKSVLLKHIVGLLEPDKGEVKVDGKEIALLRREEIFEVRSKIGFVFQGAALFDSYTVFENIIIGLWERGIKDMELLEKEALRVLTAVMLLPEPNGTSQKEYEKEWAILKEKKPSDLSGGMKKRVGVARALVGSPTYIFYDEPTTGLDPVNSQQIDHLIADLVQKLKITSIVITHDMFSVYKIADKIAMLHNGRVQFEGTTEQMLNSRDEVVMEFLERYNKN